MVDDVGALVHDQLVTVFAGSAGNVRLPFAAFFLFLLVFVHFVVVVGVIDEVVVAALVVLGLHGLGAVSLLALHGHRSYARASGV